MILNQKKYKVIQPTQKTHVPPKNSRKSNRNAHEIFLEKLKDFDDYVENFSLQEILWYFQVIAESKGYKYVIANYEKDMHIIKQLRKNYSNVEICGMIEFLYFSSQTYLRKDNLTPNILASRWINTIYADMKLWAKDEFNKPVNKDKKEWNRKEQKGSNVGGKL